MYLRSKSLLAAAGLTSAVFAASASAVTTMVYVPTILPQATLLNGAGPYGLASNFLAVMDNTPFSDQWQPWEDRGPGGTVVATGPATAGEALGPNHFRSSTPAPVTPATSTKITFGIPILRNPSASILYPTGDAGVGDSVNRGIYYHPDNYLDWDNDFKLGKVHVSYSFNDQSPGAFGPAIGFTSTRTTGTELKWEPIYNGTAGMVDQSGAANGKWYDSVTNTVKNNIWYTTPDLITTANNVWGIGGTNVGELMTNATLNSNFTTFKFLNFLIGMGSGANGSDAYTDNVRIWYDGGTIGANTYSPWDYTFNFGDTAEIPEPASLGLLAVGGLLILSRRKHA